MNECTQAMNSLINTIQGCLVFSGIVTGLLFLGLILGNDKKVSKENIK
jgi:hypothetical protein